MRQYKTLVNEVLENGLRRKGTRGGIDTIFLPFQHLQINMMYGFPLLTTKEVSWKNVIVENLWFLSGAKDIKFLRDRGCKFWDAWADKDGVVPSAYGSFWRNFRDDSDGTTIDQVQWALDSLQKNPNTRQAVISSWDPRNVIESTLPPCHTMHVLTTEPMDNGSTQLNLHLTQRSCDIALGLPYNIAGYSFLLHLYSRILKMTPGIFSHLLVDAHIYTKSEDGSNEKHDHVPGLVEQMNRPCRPLPTLAISDKIQTLRDVDDYIKSDPSVEDILETFKISDYHPYESIKFKAAV